MTGSRGTTLWWRRGGPRNVVEDISSSSQTSMFTEGFLSDICLCNDTGLSVNGEKQIFFLLNFTIDLVAVKTTRDFTIDLAAVKTTRD